MQDLARPRPPLSAPAGPSRGPVAPRAALRRPDLDLPPKYEPRRVIGTGAMGTVVLARDRSLGRLVAIKLLDTDCGELLGRLRREARLLARLEHAAIVRVHELDVHGGRLYLAMEYAAGGNLSLPRLEPLSLVKTLRGVVDALAHAHAHGIVHRDVKPENVLLTREGARSGRGPALLADFGLACGPGEGSAVLRRPIVGTPLTMSPEQIAGDPVGPASDVFSLGVTVYRKVTGEWPFRGRTVIDVFDAIRHRSPEPMHAHRRGVPRRLEAIVRRSLAKDPGERFASMEEVGRGFDQLLRGRTLFGLPFPIRRAPASSGPLIHPEDLS